MYNNNGIGQCFMCGPKPLTTVTVQGLCLHHARICQICGMSGTHDEGCRSYECSDAETYGKPPIILESGPGPAPKVVRLSEGQNPWGVA